MQPRQRGSASVPFMPRKGDRKPVNQLGTIQCVGSNNYKWRVKAKVEDPVREIDVDAYGPFRELKTEAENDLKQAQAAQTRKEYGNILRRLQTIARNQQDDAEKAVEEQDARDEIIDPDALTVDDRVVAIRGRPHGQGWRVQAKVGCRTVCGPYRAKKSDADADLGKARKAASEEYRNNLLRLGIRNGSGVYKRWKQNGREFEYASKRVCLDQLSLIKCDCASTQAAEESQSLSQLNLKSDEIKESPTETDKR